MEKKLIRVESSKIDPKHVTTQWAYTASDYDDGVILFPEASVGVMMQGSDKDFHLTRLDFVLRGRHYIVSVNRRLTRRGVIRWARKHLLALV